MLEEFEKEYAEEMENHHGIKINLNFLSKRPERETTIGKEDFCNLKIALGLCDDMATPILLETFLGMV